MIRVYQVARAAQLSNREVLQWLRDGGFDVPSHLYPLDEKEIEYLRTSMGPAVMEHVERGLEEARDSRERAEAERSRLRDIVRNEVSAQMSILSSQVHADDHARREVRLIEERAQLALDRGPTLQNVPLRLNFDAQSLMDRLAAKHYYIPHSVASRILEQLASRRIIVVKGPPGTGKTVIARLLPQLVFGLDGTKVLTEAPVGPNFTHYSLVGGLREIGRVLAPHVGVLTDAVMRCIETGGKHWLLLDELNRGDVSEYLTETLGGLSLEHGNLVHDSLFVTRAQTSAVMPVPGSFRIIGTMNTHDADQLFKFSEALVRRVGFVNLDPMEPVDEENMIVKHVLMRRPSPNSELSTAITTLLALVADLRRESLRQPAQMFQCLNLGTSIVIDMARHCEVSLTQQAVQVPAKRAVDGAFVAFAVDLLAARHSRAIDEVRRVLLKHGMEQSANCLPGRGGA